MSRFTKFAFCLLMVCVPAFCQTPCIDAAKKGIVGDCLQVKVPVTANDAQWVPVTTVPGYSVAPGLNYSTQIEFSSLEQATAVLDLLLFSNPGSVLSVSDYSNQFYFPPFRKIQYFGAATILSPRMYQITGTVVVGGSSFPVSFSVGWLVNVTKLIYGGSFETQALGFPFGSSMLVAIQEQGGVQPVWVGGPQQQQ